MATKHTIRLDNGKGLILAIDSTQELSETFKSKATTLPTANKESVADHFIKENPTFNFSGVISGVYNPKQPLLTQSAILSQNFRNVIEKGNIVEFTSGDRSYLNCHVDMVNLKRDVEVGVNGWRISLNLTQIKIASGGKESVVSVNSNVTDQAANKKSVGSSSTKDVNSIVQVKGADTFFSLSNNTYAAAIGG